MPDMQDEDSAPGHYPRRRRLADHAPGTQATSEADRTARKLLVRIAQMEAEIAVLGQAVSPVAQSSRTTGAVNKDARWHCEKCGYLLGFYDVGSDIMRTRYKEHIVFVRCGPGGFIQVVCRGCSEINTQQHVEPEGAAD